jgi:hypothetical protein
MSIVFGGVGLPDTTHCNETKSTHSIQNSTSAAERRVTRIESSGRNWSHRSRDPAIPSEPDPEVIMKSTITIMFLLAGAGSALGQTGVSNQRDMYGNLVRDGNSYSARGVNQGPQNNGAVRSMPTQPTTANIGRIRTQTR